MSVSSPQAATGLLCWSIMVHHYSGSTTKLMPEEQHAAQANMSHLSCCLCTFLYFPFAFSFASLTHYSMRTWSNNAYLLCHALQRAGSTCQKPASHFQDRTATPWTNPNTQWIWMVDKLKPGCMVEQVDRCLYPEGHKLGGLLQKKTDMLYKKWHTSSNTLLGSKYKNLAVHLRVNSKKKNNACGAVCVNASQTDVFVNQPMSLHVGTGFNTKYETGLRQHAVMESHHREGSRK